MSRMQQQHPSSERLLDLAKDSYYGNADIGDHVRQCGQCQADVQDMRRLIQSSAELEGGAGLPIGEDHLDSEQIFLYIKGSLPANRQRRIREHSELCDECRLAVLAARAEWHALRREKRRNVFQAGIYLINSLLGRGQWREAAWPALLLVLLVTVPLNLWLMSSARNTISPYQDDTNVHFQKEAPEESLSFVPLPPRNQHTAPVEVLLHRDKLSLTWRPIAGTKRYHVIVAAVEQDGEQTQIQTDVSESKAVLQPFVPVSGKRYIWRITGKSGDEQFWLEGGFVAR